jgi:hypothetical protein
VKRFLDIFVLTLPEQRLIIVLVLLLVGGVLFKHHRDLQNTLRPQPSPSASPSPQGTRPGM